MCRLIFIVNSSQYKFKVIISETSFISRNLLIFPSAYLLDFSFLRPISGALYLLESVIPSILGVFTVVGSFFHGRVGKGRGGLGKAGEGSGRQGRGGPGRGGEGRAPWGRAAGRGGVEGGGGGGGGGRGVMSRRSKYWPPWLTNGRNLKKILAKTS